MPQVLLNDKLPVPSGRSGPLPGSFSGFTASGAAVSADVLLVATGIHLNTGFMRPELGDALDNASKIKVGSW